MQKLFFEHILIKNRTIISNQDDHRPILHTSSDAFQQWKCFILW